MAKGGATEGIYSATYSGIPVYEYQFGVDLKEHVMRRRSDDWINATHILKAAGFDKPARTRILEREVQKDVHEKIQGGYGKYQGTWIPLEKGEDLAVRNQVFDRLRPIFEYVPGNESPPPAPRHTSKPKQPKPRPSVPKWSSQPHHDDYDNGDGMNEDDTPDNLTVASASYMAEDDRFDISQSTGHRKRKPEDVMQDMTEQHHAVYGDELLDYFLLSRNEKPAFRPEPPPNFQPDWVIDTEQHTALHWACAMGDIDVIKQLKRFGATLAIQNIRGETPFMRSVNFTNCYEKQSFPQVMKELFDTVGARDLSGCTVIHHAAVMKAGRPTSHSCQRYYLDNILNKLQETHEPSFVQQLIDAQDNDGNTALHLAAQRNARKCIRALLGRNASTDVANNEGIRAEELIQELNATKKERGPQRSSSPFAPDSQRHASFRDVMAIDSKPGALVPGGAKKNTAVYQSEAANSVSSRITPLVMEKFQDLARSYEEEWSHKNEAEADARRILLNTQAELQVTRQQAAELEHQLEPDETAARVHNEAALAKHHVLSLITHQNRLQVQAAVDQAVSMANGDAAAAAAGGDGDITATSGDATATPSSSAATSYEERLALAHQLQQLLDEQRQAEADYVEALSMVGTGDTIEKYRRLLKKCLDPKDADSLDANLDSLIEMMEEEHGDLSIGGLASGGEPMELTVGM